MRNAWGYARSVDSSRGSYTITSGNIRAGAEAIGEFSSKHVLTADERALLQGFEKVPIWPKRSYERDRRGMVSQCVPPPFAEQLSIAVFGHQVTALERARAWAKLSVIDSMEDDAVIPVHLELPQGWLSCTDVVGASFGATGTSTRAVSEFEKRGKHGRWKSLGEFGWCRATVADAEHMRTVRPP